MYKGLISKTMLYERENEWKNVTELEARLRIHTLQIDVTGILNVKLYKSETNFALVLSMYVKQ